MSGQGSPKILHPTTNQVMVSPYHGHQHVPHPHPHPDTVWKKRKGKGTRERGKGGRRRGMGKGRQGERERRTFSVLNHTSHHNGSKLTETQVLLSQEDSQNRITEHCKLEAPIGTAESNLGLHTAPCNPMAESGVPTLPELQRRGCAHLPLGCSLSQPLLTLPWQPHAVPSGPIPVWSCVLPPGPRLPPLLWAEQTTALSPHNTLCHHQCQDGCLSAPGAAGHGPTPSVALTALQRLAQTNPRHSARRPPNQLCFLRTKVPGGEIQLFSPLLPEESNLLPV